MEPGFRGSPAPRDESEKENGLRNRKGFAEAFRSERECFGMTLELSSPEKADFGMQLFEDDNGQTNEWRWVLYRMDTLGERAHGIVSRGGINEVAKSICSSIHNTISHPGGQVEDQ